MKHLSFDNYKTNRNYVMYYQTNCDSPSSWRYTIIVNINQHPFLLFLFVIHFLWVYNKCIPYFLLSHRNYVYIIYLKYYYYILIYLFIFLSLFSYLYVCVYYNYYNYKYIYKVSQEVNAYDIQLTTSNKIQLKFSLYITYNIVLITITYIYFVFNWNN